MVPLDKLGPDLNGKVVNETQYRGMTGSLMYLTASRPDIQFLNCLCARYQANPKESYLIVVKRIFRYLKGTPSLGLWYLKCSGFDLKGYSDSNYAGCNMDRKSTSAEAEYVAAAGCCANILWMKSQRTYYDIIYEKVPIFCYKTSAIAISNNLILHSRTKDIDIIYHFIRDHILKGDIELHFIPTQYQLADIFTKPLDEKTFKRLIVELDQVEFTFDEITFITNNEVALLYPSHPNSEYFEIFSDFISKCCLKEAFTRAPNQYVEYLAELWPWFSSNGYNGEIGATGTLKKSRLPHRWRLLMAQIIQCLEGKTCGLDQISNKDATILYCLENRVKVDFARIIWEDIIHKLNKKTREKSVPYPRFIYLLLEYIMHEYDHEDLTINPTQVFSAHNWALKANQPEGPPFTDHMKAICNIDVPVESQAPTTSSKTEMKAKDKSPSHHLAPTHVVSKMHKEAQQTAGGPTSLGATSEEGAHPQFYSGCDALSDSTTEDDPRISAPNDFIPEQQDQTKSAGDGLKTAHTDLGTNEESRSNEISKKIKLEDLSDLMQDTRSDFFTPDSSQDEPIIVSDESEEKETEKDKDTRATSHDVPEYTSSQKDKPEQQKAKAKVEVASLKVRPSFPYINQLTELLITSLKPELSKLLASHDFDTCLPTELKELPSKITELSGDVKELKKHVRVGLSEGKLAHLEQPMTPLPYPVVSQAERDAYEALNDAQNEVACLMLGSMSPELQRTLENYKACDMIQELKTMFEEQAKQELFETVKAFHACKQEDAIRKGKIQKDKKKPQGSKGKAKGKNKLAYAPKTKIPPPPKRENPAKDSICNHCMEGLRSSKKLKHGALSLYMGNGMRAAVEAIKSFDLILPSGLIIVLDNYHFAPTVTRGVVLISRLVKNSYIHTFTNYGISVSKDNVFYFNAIPRDDIYEINMHNIYPNVSSNYNVSNKRAKHGLDYYYLWHYRLGHINKKHMDMLQHDGLLQPTHDESHEKCKSCISGKMVYIRAIRILLAIDAFYDYEIWEMDVKTAFLNGHLSEDVYIVLPEGFVDLKYPNKVCKLQCSIYGLKQTSRNWNKRFDEEIKKIGFTQNLDEPCVYHKASGSNVAFFVLYVDEILLMGNSIAMLQEVKSWLCSIMYAVRCTRPDVVFAQNLCSRFQQNPVEIHWTAVKTFLKYLRNTKDMVLVYGAKPEDELKVSCYADASFQTYKDDTKSQMGYVFVLNGGAVDWKSAKQSTTVMSSTEAEYIAAVEASMQAVWMRKFIDGLGGVMPSNKRSMEMLCDNEPALAIAEDPRILKGARHFQKKYHYICEVIQRGKMDVDNGEQTKVLLPHLCLYRCDPLHFTRQYVIEEELASKGFRSFSVIQAATAATFEVVVCQVEAKYKALLFKQQITVYVEKIYGIIRGDFNEELGSLLTLCIQGDIFAAEQKLYKEADTYCKVLLGRVGFLRFPVIQAATAATLEVVVCQVEAKYKALLFKQQITVYVEKIYGIIRGDFNEELGSLLTVLYGETLEQEARAHKQTYDRVPECSTVVVSICWRECWNNWPELTGKQCSQTDVATRVNGISTDSVAK
ncbi:retrovirus-related pol polyprotein from transposon TNT 1-94 [Tanacetum coccineum]